MNSLWLNLDKKSNEFSSLSSNSETDVCIIGAGIFGLTCAYYLSHLGFKVNFFFFYGCFIFCY